MSKFTGYGRANHIDFGDYVKYPFGMSHEPHIFKVVGYLESNSYRDVPYWARQEETSHEEIVPCLKIIHCGIDETEVIRVRQADCIKMEVDR